MLKMIKLNNYSFFKKTLISLSCFFTLIFLCLYQKIAFSQTNHNKREPLSNAVSTDIKVRKLDKPSLGSLGVNTETNNLLGLNIWQNMKAEDIIEHLNYLPDTLASKNLQIFLNDLYLSRSVPPIGNSKYLVTSWGVIQDDD